MVDKPHYFDFIMYLCLKGLFIHRHVFHIHENHFDYGDNDILWW